MIPFVTLLLFAELLVVPGVSGSTIVPSRDGGNMVHYALIPHRRQLERRRQERQLQKDNTNRGDASLYQGMGTHYIDLYVGTPTFQKQTLIVDTGSTWTAFPCAADCCGQHTDAEFHFHQSESFSSRSCEDTCGQICSRSRKNCQLQMTYSEGSSWTAFEAQDQVSLWGLQATSDANNNGDDREENANLTFSSLSLTNPFSLRFGCQTATTKLFRTQLADGIMGMDDSSMSFWRQAGADTFSLCFSNSSVSALQDSAGVLTLGGYDDRLHLDDNTMQWAARDQSNRGRFFGLHLQNMYFVTKGNKAPIVTEIEGFSVRTINAGGLILDSGTTNTFLPASQGKAFQDAFRQLTGHAWATQLSLEEVQVLPTLVIQLRGWNSTSNDVRVEFPPYHYMQPTEEDDNIYEASLVFWGSEAILGADFMQGNNINFGASDRVGFAPSDCDYNRVETLQQYSFQPSNSSVKMAVQKAKPVNQILDVEDKMVPVFWGVAIAIVIAIAGWAMAGSPRREKIAYEVVESDPVVAEIQII